MRHKPYLAIILSLNPAIRRWSKGKFVRYTLWEWVELARAGEQGGRLKEGADEQDRSLFNGIKFDEDETFTSSFRIPKMQALGICPKKQAPLGLHVKSAQENIMLL